jgi:hypothetical protein
MRLPSRLPAWLLVITACAGFLQFKKCPNGAACDPAKPHDTVGSCAIDGAAPGSHNGPCTDAGGCNSPGDACILDACISCGTAGHVCCDQAGTTGCSGSVCVDGVEDFPTCTAGCGAVGSACCPGIGDPCPTSGYCEFSTQQCIPDLAGPGTTYVVWLKTPGRCATSPYYFNAANDSDAQAQANAHLADVNNGMPVGQKLTLGALNDDPDKYDVCEYPTLQLNVIDPLTLYAFSLVDLASCEHEIAGGSSAANWGWQGPNNSCPAQPNMNPPP